MDSTSVPVSVFVRLPRSLAVALDAAASEAGLSRAGWVRREILRALPSASEVPSLPSSPRRRPAVIPEADLAEISRMSAAVSRSGGAVVQLCKVFREGGYLLHIDAEAVLSDLRAVQREIGRVVARLSI